MASSRPPAARDHGPATWVLSAYVLLLTGALRGGMRLRVAIGRSRRDLLLNLLARYAPPVSPHCQAPNT
ncbi:MAG: hypothetical protein AB2A00_20970 [Myxococcota bacterium]